ncbi:Hypothetical protein, putative [Bodo saltans]|uniref:Uncharacterized protein n=1 Tax=Bodo saltans TaxID=75058 RepID=A0A0S4IV61_BODSA|nr:Hypothetical protein, putative [Bodo saltans]|eukprot:CUG02310.1 Hypothetical protein, putative [Bodo saltans]
MCWQELNVVESKMEIQNTIKHLRGDPVRCCRHKVCARIWVLLGKKTNKTATKKHKDLRSQSWRCSCTCTPTKHFFRELLTWDECHSVFLLSKEVLKILPPTNTITK